MPHPWSLLPGALLRLVFALDQPGGSSTKLNVHRPSAAPARVWAHAHAAGPRCPTRKMESRGPDERHSPRRLGLVVQLVLRVLDQGTSLKPRLLAGARQRLERQPQVQQSKASPHVAATSTALVPVHMPTRVVFPSHNPGRASCRCWDAREKEREKVEMEEEMLDRLSRS
ncbi:hypothetical protein K456DRAFT_1004742 [Colletotrichum gloeosporioides 23]|nr:hypothetical protein K456DRAFT_1004742 [Colletotrichum gloeosporioides 23]